MALIRGFGGKYPCPICLVPKDKLSKLENDYLLRTTEDMEGAYKLACKAPTAAMKESILKSIGLRGLPVSLTQINDITLTVERKECFLEHQQFRSIRCTLVGPTSRLSRRFVQGPFVGGGVEACRSRCRQKAG